PHIILSFVEGCSNGCRRGRRSQHNRLAHQGRLWLFVSRHYPAGAFRHAPEHNAKWKPFTVRFPDKNPCEFNVSRIAADVPSAKTDGGSWSCGLKESFGVDLDLSLHFGNCSLSDSGELRRNCRCWESSKLIFHSGSVDSHLTIRNGQHTGIKCETRSGY